MTLDEKYIQEAATRIMGDYVIDIDGARGKVELDGFMFWPKAIYNNLHGRYDDDYMRADNRRLIEVRPVHLPDDAITVITTGKLGEYFGRTKGFIAA